MVLLSRAVPAYTKHEIEWGISLARGWAEIHCARILDGTPMVWPRLQDSALGRWFLGIRKRIRKLRRAAGLGAD